MAGYEERLVWRAARQLAGEVYNVSASAGFRGDRSLRDQLRRASISIPSNIAEGHQRKYRRDFARFLTISLGSVGEVRTQLYIAGDLGYLSPSEQRRLLEAFQQLAAGIERLRLVVLRQADAGP